MVKPRIKHSPLGLIIGYSGTRYTPISLLVEMICSPQIVFLRDGLWH